MRTFLPMLIALAAMGCSPTDPSEKDGETPGVDDPGFSAEIRAERPIPQVAFAIQPAEDDRAEKVAMTCEGNLCSVETSQPGEWRLWGTAPGFMITYNKVIPVTTDGSVSSVSLDQFGDYGIDLTGLMYEDNFDGEQYTIKTDYIEGKVGLKGFSPGFSGMLMLGNDLHLDLGDGYVASGVILDDLSFKVDVLHNGAIVESHEYVVID